MQMGCDGVFVGSGIFKSSNPEAVAKGIVNAVNHYNDKKVLLEASTGLGKLMFGVNATTLKDSDKLATRGW